MRTFTFICSIFILFGFNECQSPEPQPLNKFRSCKIVKIDGQHFGAIVTKENNKEYLESVCNLSTEPVDYRLNQSCPNQTFSANGNANRKYRPVPGTDGIREYQVLIEGCWSNCGSSNNDRISCEYNYPAGCIAAKQLSGPNPCKAFN